MGKPGAKKMDQIVSVTPGDVHIIMIPSPGGPVPTPIPHPCASMIKDKVATKVKVMGQPGAVKGSKSKHTPPHIPMGPGPFQKPPKNEGEIITGSSSVFYEGKEAAMLGDTGQMCSDPSDTPVGKVIGTAATVLIGGGSSGGDAERAAASAAAMKAAQAACDPNKCSQEGDPVNVATGEVTTAADDIRLPGLIPMAFQRSYASTQADQESDLGFGWKHSWDYRLTLKDDSLEYQHAGSRILNFEIPDVNGEVKLVEEGFTLSRKTDEWAVRTPTGRQVVFPVFSPDSGTVLASQLRDSFGNALTFEYDNASRLTEIRDPAQRSLLLRRDPRGRIIGLEFFHRAEAVRHIIRMYEYDESGDLTGVVDACGKRRTYKYDRHLLVSHTDRNGYTWYFTYDEQRRCRETWGPDGLLYRKFFYSPTGAFRTLVVDSAGNQWVYKINADRLTTAMTTPLGYSESYIWSEKYQLLAKTDRNGATTSYEYDPKSGNPTVINDPEGNTWAFEYNDSGCETKCTHPNGGSVIREYDQHGALAKSIDPLGAITHYKQDDRGLTRQIILPDGQTWNYGYDAGGFLSECFSGDGAYRERYRHDLYGRLVEIYTASGQHILREYDREGRLLKQSDDEGVNFENVVDGEGGVVQYTTADGSVTRRKWDALGAMTEKEEPPLSPGAPPRRTRFVYNGESALVEIVGPTNQHYRYVYDEDRRLIQAKYPDGRIVKLTYDGEKNVILRKNADGSLVTTEYDLLGRAAVKNFTNSDGSRSRCRYEYNADSQITRAEKDDYIVETEFDLLGRQVRESQDGHEFSYEYDWTGRRTKMVYPNGQEVCYEYDDGAHTLVIDSQLHGRLSYTYDHLYRLKESLAPNGVAESFTYDRKSRLTGQEMRVRGARHVRDYTYQAGRLKEVTEDAHKTLHLQYVAEDRVVRASIPAERELNYSFDANNNVTRSPEGANWTYGTGDRLLGSPRKKFAYDPDGRVVQADSESGRARYFYDAEGLLTRVEKSDKTVVSFAYDGFARRVSKKVNDVEVRFLWDVAVPVVEQNCQRTSYNLFFPEAFSPIARCDTTGDAVKVSEQYYYHLDQVGAVYRVTAKEGREVWSASYTPLGEAEIGSGSAIQQPFRTTGEYWDDELDLGYHRKRYYDPSVGRFTTHDPNDILGGLNLYVFYCNAYQFYDPLGTASQWDYIRPWSAGYEDYVRRRVCRAGAGHESVDTGFGRRDYDNAVTNRGVTTYYEAKYIGQNGMSDDAMNRARTQLAKDEDVMANNPDVKVKWIFSRDPPADLKKDLDALKAQYPGQFDYEVRKPPSCFETTYVDPHRP
jgi:RHS repeat-associated protein